MDQVTIMRLLIVVTSVICVASFCEADSSVKYTFPFDALNNVWQPQIPLKDGETVYVGFNGDFDQPECRKMSFQIPQSSFWKYKVCLKLLYYTSPKCQSKVLFVPSSFKNYANDGWNADDYKRVMTGIECPKPAGIGSYRRLEEGEEYCNLDFYGFDIQLGKNVQKHKEANRGWNRWSWESHQNLKTTTVTPVPDHINDHFSIEITATLEYKVELIAEICGGLIGLIVLVVIITCICMCLCRRKRRQTGRYIPEGTFGEITESPKASKEVTESTKVSNEAKSHEEEKGKWLSTDGLDKSDEAPLILLI